MKIEEVKRNLNKPVVYNGVKGVYKFTACIIRKEENEYYYQAEVADTKQGNSVSICELKDIQVE